MKYSEKIQKILQQITKDAGYFSEKRDEFIEKLKKLRDSLFLIEDRLSDVGSLTDSFMNGIEEINAMAEEIEEVKEIKESMLSLRFETMSILEDLVNYIPDALLRENLKIFSGILRDREKIIKADSIFLLFKKSA